ncbi:hypothetical protein E4U30_005484 [Claviceps sp. LM220 group G6]|nr:hypothetical protein E4U30_005484 [Claviceps sp. LM220 group G6]KAG6109711.1 hypothetical protein E4U31_006667 [Claviceps sp. LM219 group G6]KAG6117756.1 hypothetical protein E4U14_007536 [Claviceps sp. LM454 group G7]
MAEQDGASESARLDKEIAALRRQATSLRKQLQIQCSTILSSASTSRLIQSASSSSSTPAQAASHAAKLSTRSTQQQAYMQQCIYRISAPVTSFKVRDPDPHAVDQGHVLGLRFEVMSRGQFLRPYYVMLNRPYPGSKHVRVHRHTVPPAVPLAGLAARYLPAPSSRGRGPQDDDAGAALAAAAAATTITASGQKLDRFVRTLRREIVRYHNRLGVSADLRRRLGLHGDGAAQNALPNALVEVGIADIEAKQINLTWADERTGRLVMDDDGKVIKFVVFGVEGRDWEASGDIFTKDDGIEDVARKLEEYMEASVREED